MSKSVVHPMQPLVRDRRGVIEDLEQIAQLIGYSVNGFGELSYARRTTVQTADKLAARLYAQSKKGKGKP